MPFKKTKDICFKEAGYKFEVNCKLLRKNERKLEKAKKSFKCLCSAKCIFINLEISLSNCFNKQADFKKINYHNRIILELSTMNYLRAKHLANDIITE